MFFMTCSFTNPFLRQIFLILPKVVVVDFVWKPSKLIRFMLHIKSRKLHGQNRYGIKNLSECFNMFSELTGQ
jgi:hypothetical protein